MSDSYLYVFECAFGGYLEAKLVNIQTGDVVALK